MTDDKSWQPGTAIDDVPLKVTEERFAAESQRNRRPVNPVGAVPLVSSAPAAPGHDSAPRPAPTAVRDPAGAASSQSTQQRNAVSVRRPSTYSAYGSILNLNDVPLRQPGTSAREEEDYEQESINRRARVRKRRRIPLLWRVTLVLIVALAAGVWYSYLAVERHSVITAQLPGAATVSAIETEGAQARSKLQDFGTQVLDFEHRTSAALSAASDDAQHLAAEVRDRYRRWRASQ